MASCNTSQANSIVCQSPWSDTPNAVTLFQRPCMRYKWTWSMMGVHARANSLASLAGAGMSLKVETGNNDLKRRSVFWVYKYSTRSENVSGLLIAIGMTGRATMKPGWSGTSGLEWGRGGRWAQFAAKTSPWIGWRVTRFFCEADSRE